MNPAKQNLDRTIGGKETELKHIAEQSDKLQEQINEINSLDDINLLRQAFANRDSERKSIETKINRIEHQKLSSQEIKRKISERTENITQHNKRIKNYASQLIHNLTDKQEDKELLNFILSPDFSSLPSHLLHIKITTLEQTMKLFDGEIKLPSDIGKKKIESIESLKEKLEELTKEKEEFEELLPIALDFEKAQKELVSINAQIDIIKQKIQKIVQRPNLEKQLKESTEQVMKITGRKGKFRKRIEEA